MSINVFFTLVLGLLLAMFAYFKPNYPTDEKQGEIPKIQLQTFTLYEVSRRGVDHILEGEEGKKFEDRYEITSAKFSDNTKSMFQTIRSDNALYRDKILDVNGHVVYQRSDNLIFRSNEGKYNTNNAVITTQGPFVITQNGNRVEGRKLNYNTDKKTVSADAVRGSYQLD